MEKKKKSHIYLIGFMGTGKSTVSKTLKELLRWKEIEMDDEIVRECGMEIPAIFEKYGENGAFEENSPRGSGDSILRRRRGATQRKPGDHERQRDHCAAFRKTGNGLSAGKGKQQQTFAERPYERSRYCGADGAAKRGLRVRLRSDCSYGS